MGGEQLVHRGTVPWFVSTLAHRELYPPSGLGVTTVVLVCAVAAFYLVPAYVIWRLVAGYVDRFGG